MYGFTVQLFVSTHSMLIFTLTDKTVFLTNSEAFSTTITDGFLWSAHTSALFKSIKVLQSAVIWRSIEAQVQSHARY